jgi:hypothetical protein
MRIAISVIAILLSSAIAEARHFHMPIIITVPGGGHASTEKTTLSGKPIKVSFWRELNPDCTVVPGLVVKLSTPPEHGRASLSKGHDFPGYTRNNIRASCNKRRVSGTLIHYVSQRGYTGTDRFAVEVFTSSGGHQTQSYTINVK